MLLCFILHHSAVADIHPAAETAAGRALKGLIYRNVTSTDKLQLRQWAIMDSSLHVEAMTYRHIHHTCAIHTDFFRLRLAQGRLVVTLLTRLSVLHPR